MAKRILSNILKWIRTKVTLAIAFIYFVWHLPKTLKIIKQKRVQALKDENVKNKLTSGSKEEAKEDPKGVDDVSSRTKKFEFKWNLSPEELKEYNAEDENIDRLIKKIEFSSQDQSLNVKEVEDTLQKILDSEWGEEVMQEPPEPIHMLSLKKEQDMFYSLQRKTFVPVKNNIEVPAVLETILTLVRLPAGEKIANPLFKLHFKILRLA